MEEVVSRLDWVKHVSLSGNLCTDKKPAAVNWVMGRGKTVSAEAVIKRDVVGSVLKTTPEAVMKVVSAKLYVGSALAGALGGFNAHVANVIAAVFIATGQDLAQVVESSESITYADITPAGDLYFSLTIPSLEVGTVGGGTWLPAQRAALSIMGVAGPGDPPGTNARKFAEVVAKIRGVKVRRKGEEEQAQAPTQTSTTEAAGEVRVVSGACEPSPRAGA
ncbi:MAG: hypothetical protein NZ733_06355 [Aigarchaeota archaeon]|nr:hypothetical protein [Aigarchaeota archaeon]